MGSNRSPVSPVRPVSPVIADSEGRIFSVVLPEGLHKKMARPLGHSPGLAEGRSGVLAQINLLIIQSAKDSWNNGRHAKLVFCVDETIGCDITFVGQGTWPTSPNEN